MDTHGAHRGRVFCGALGYRWSIGLMATNGMGIPLDYLSSTPFTSYVVPGMILSVVVGGSALAATLLLLRHQRLADLTAFGAGAIMVGWIIVEVLMLRQFSWLQWCYLVVGVALMGLATQIEEIRQRKASEVYKAALVIISVRLGGDVVQWFDALTSMLA